MNLQLEDTEEFIEGQFAGTLGEVLIRCNNVLYVKATDLKKEVCRRDRGKVDGAWRRLRGLPRLRWLPELMDG